MQSKIVFELVLLDRQQIKFKQPVRNNNSKLNKYFYKLFANSATR